MNLNFGKTTTPSGGLNFGQSTNTQGINLAPAPAADPLTGPDGLNGIFWVGANGNVYVQDNNRQVRDMGPSANLSTADVAKYRQVADQNPQNTTNTSIPNGVSGGSGSSTSYPDLSGAIEILRQNISALDPIYQASVATAIKNYDIANNERQTTFNTSKASSDASSLSNDQNVLQSRNAIDKNARMSSEDIMSILGALGMNGSTSNNAINTIADKSNGDLNTANYGYGKNKQSILQSWNDFVNKDANQQKQLVDQKNYDVAQAGITRATAQKDALGQIASNKIAMGQGTGDVLGELAGVNNTIAGLSTVPKTYTGTTPTYTAPTISTLLGPNTANYAVSAGTPGGVAPSITTAPKLIKVNEQTGNGDKYGLTQ